MNILDVSKINFFGLKDFFHHMSSVLLHIRWVKLRVAMCPWLLFFEPLSECFVLGVVSAWAVNYLFGFARLSFFLVHVLVWFLMDWKLLHIVQVCKNTNDSSSSERLQSF